MLTCAFAEYGCQSTAFIVNKLTQQVSSISHNARLKQPSISQVAHITNLGSKVLNINEMINEIMK